MKKQITKWFFKYDGCDNETYIKIGWIYNKNKDVKADKVRVKIHSVSDDIDFDATVSEALAICAGIERTLCIQTIKGNIK